jgi:hypothetical protein
LFNALSAVIVSSFSSIWSSTSIFCRTSTRFSPLGSRKLAELQHSALIFKVRSCQWPITPNIA